MMDIIVITTRNSQQKAYWEQRLDQTFPNFLFIVVIEDWPGGAGNGLGTLYAFTQANIIAQKQYNRNLFKLLEGGASISLYHCAGEGQRLYPLSASEHNNKAALKLPGMIVNQGNPEPITLLEAILIQTKELAIKNSGRLFVYWGDQLFFPSLVSEKTSFYPLEIYIKPIPFPDHDEWNKLHLEKYGIICFDADGKGHLLEKCPYTLLQEFVNNGWINPFKGLHLSLGSFSLSCEMLKGLLEVFSQELTLKKGKLDSDPHFWMPLTLPLNIYQQLMLNKGMDHLASKNLFERLAGLKKQFKDPFGTYDLGADCSWWDFGNVQAYVKNLLKTLEETDEAKRMRNFLNMPSSGILNSQIKKGTVARSIVMNTTAEELNVEDSVIIGCHLYKASCKKSVLYNIYEEEPIIHENGIVRSDVEGIQFYSTVDSDPKQHWNERLANNSMSWEELHAKINQESVKTPS